MWLCKWIVVRAAKHSWLHPMPLSHKFDVAKIKTQVRWLMLEISALERQKRKEGLLQVQGQPELQSEALLHFHWAELVVTISLGVSKCAWLVTGTGDILMTSPLLYTEDLQNSCGVPGLQGVTTGFPQTHSKEHLPCAARCGIRKPWFLNPVCNSHTRPHFRPRSVPAHYQPV